MKILVISPAWIGDAVMAQSLYKQLKKNDPQSHLTVLVPQDIAPLITLMPEVDHFIPTTFSSGRLQLKARLTIAKSFQGQFDWAIILPRSLKSALIPWLARIPKRTGWHGEGRYFMLNDRRTGIKKFSKMVDRYQALGQSLSNDLPPLYPQLQIAVQNQKGIIKQFKLSIEKPVIALCIGAAYGPAKRWPHSYFAKLAQLCIANSWQIWIFGSGNEKHLAQAMMEALPVSIHNEVQNFTGKTTLLESVYLLANAWQVVTNDSGLMHIAAALTLPMVCIYGSSSPIYTPALNTKAIILHTKLSCQPCFQRQCPLKHMQCLYQITPEQVLIQLQNQQKDLNQPPYPSKVPVAF